MITASITPKFDSKVIYNEWIEKNWFEFQEKVFELGNEMLAYIQQFITSKTHRDGSTGNLVRSIKLYPQAGAGTAEVGWGIGLMSEMDTLAPYWYLINFGGYTTIAKEGRGVAGFFGSNNAPDSTLAGSGVGTERFNQSSADGRFYMKPHSLIIPMNYIESSRFELDRALQHILTSIKG